MKRTRSKKIATIGSLVALIGISLFVAFSAISPVVAAILQLYEDTYFTYTDADDNVFKCYSVDGDSSSVAVAWGLNPSDTPDELTVPSTVYDEESHAYTVKGIAKGGFRYCDFSEINLPNTIIDIKEEAFAYCTNLIEISLPYAIDRIAPSTFLDCRSLTSVHYLKQDGTTAFGNDQITSIGDHAFFCCVSLRDFYCPKSVTFFGQSCFQNCETIRNFYFPSAKYSGDDITNYITVESYAFADCTQLTFIYFETNMQEIDNYAFVNCASSARIKYTGSSDPVFYKNSVLQEHWNDFNIATNLTNQIPIDPDHPTILVDDNCPCLRYTIETKVVKLDSAQGLSNCKVTLIGAEEAALGYAAIYKFDTPNESDDCFDVETGTLTIPETLGGKTVKVINANTFSEKDVIRHIVFSAGLVQIANHAFYKCENIESIDFSRCQHLKEVSYYCFNDSHNETTNSAVTEILLPDCLEYVGNLSFGNFVSVNRFHMSTGMKVIDDCAFFRLGYAVTDAQIDLVLPKTLSDSKAKDAYMKHIDFYDPVQNKSFQHKSYGRIYAVGKYAFIAANGIRTVVMEDDPDNETNLNVSTSFCSNGFKDCVNLLSFKANGNIKYVGKDLFKNTNSTSQLKEVFLKTYKARNATSDKNYPWCIDEENGSYGGSLFFGIVSDVVCYIDYKEAPGLLDKYEPATEPKDQVGHCWNAENGATYVNETGTTGTSNLGYFSRTCVPTFYNVDFENDIKYWDPATKQIVASPTIEHYSTGIVSFVRTTEDPNPVEYTVARYWHSYDNTSNDHSTGNGVKLVDLTQVPGISDGTNNLLTKIGSEAFAKCNEYNTYNDSFNKQPGLYFVLPSTITSIGERAFYRRTKNANGNSLFGVRIVTYKSGSSYISNDGTTTLDGDGWTAKMTSADSSKSGYCCLPAGVTEIGRDAFYNNTFSEVHLGANLSFIGNAAFFTNNGGGQGRSLVTSITMATNANFEIINNGVYYKAGGADKKTLFYQVAGATGDFTVAAGTKALALNALAGTKYSKVTLPSGLTTIYGAALARNLSLTEVDGVSDLRYISSMENAYGVDTGWNDDSYDEIWDDTMDTHYSNIDSRHFSYLPRLRVESLYGALADCTALTTFNFKSLSEIRKIGYGAFNNCTNLSDMSGGDSYTFKYVNNNGVLDTSKGTNKTGILTTNETVCDLSNCTHLRCINKSAFTGCNKLKFLILPDNMAPSATESAIYIGSDPEAPFSDKKAGAVLSGSKGTAVLVKEKIIYSHRNVGTTAIVEKHYPNNIFASGNTVYYYVESNADFAPGDNTATSTTYKYWTIDGSGNYILFNSTKGAKIYMGW